jgi:tetratricopeptide (TPR) repeat protein
MGRGRGRGRGGRGGSGRGGGGDGDGDFEDQYGASMVSQDRGQHAPARGRGGGGGTGGGDAGGGRGGRGVAFDEIAPTRELPKFLQAHAHLLGAGRGGAGGAGGEDGPAVEAPEAEARAERLDDEEDALRRALELDPSLAEAHPELRPVANRVEAAALKARGNAAFAAGDHAAASAAFRRCEELDPADAVYASNASATLCALKQYSDALGAARRALALRPGWAKAHARAGAALLGLERFGEAADAYARAAELEPGDRALFDAMQRARAADAREASEGRHKFKRKAEEDAGGAGAAAKRREAPAAHAPAGAAVRNRTLLSFGDEEEDAGDDE